MQNDTTDDLSLKMRTLAEACSEKLNLKAEINAVIAMIKPDYDPPKHQTSDTINTIKDKTGVLKDLLAHYIRKEHDSTYPGIKDRRIKQLDGSAVQHIPQLAQFPESSHSSEVLKFIATTIQQQNLCLLCTFDCS